ncbi:hypothetical protein GmHk_13G037060 [Glycine max]|nr:hypothetical protein GmHk_13G037060 [Glycine max]
MGSSTSFLQQLTFLQHHTSAYHTYSSAVLRLEKTGINITLQKTFRWWCPLLLHVTRRGNLSLTLPILNTLDLECRVPAKAITLVWRLLLGRLPTKDNLQKRNVMLDPSNLRCSFCNHLSTIHGNNTWLDIAMVLHEDLHINLRQHSTLQLSKLQGERWLVVWLVNMWRIWYWHKQCVFVGSVSFDSKDMHDVLATSPFIHGQLKKLIIFAESYHSSSTIVREGYSSVKMQSIANNGIIASWFDSAYFLDVLITTSMPFKYLILFFFSLVTSILLKVFYRILKFKQRGNVARKIKEYI